LVGRFNDIRLWPVMRDGRASVFHGAGMKFSQCEMGANCVGYRPLPFKRLRYAKATFHPIRTLEYIVTAILRPTVFRIVLAGTELNNAKMDFC